MTWLIVLGVLLLLVLIWFCIEQHLLIVRKEKICLEHLPPEWDELTILQISDLHHRKMGRENCRIVRKAQELRPDWIVITGDLVSRDVRDFTETAHFLKRLQAICPVYLCPGNHELDMSPEIQNQLAETIQNAGCTLLSDKTAVLYRGSVPLYLAGAALSYGIYRDENRGFRHLTPYTAVDLTHALGHRRGCTILLAHNPFLMDTYAEWGADLVLCGHVHGGLVRLPLVGGLLSPERKFFPPYDKGSYRRDQTQMYVSGGIGKPRLCNPPELNLLHLKSVQK